MRSLIWKEWRENVKWIALPTLVILGPTALFGAYELVNVGTLFYVSLVAAVFGAALGFLQVFFESTGDKRSLLLHRPMSRSQIFLAKAIVGVGLYLFALGIPFACAVGLAATPGHLYQPFRWSMVLPWLTDILVGLVYYFAGMLTAQREARWYGSRCLGLAAGLFCSIVVWTVPQFWQALVAVIVLGGLAAIAAWSSFSAGGAYAPQPRFAKIALAVSFLSGLIALGFTGKVLIGIAHARKTEYQSVLDRQGRVLFAFIEKGEILSITDRSSEEPQEFKGKRLSSHDFRDLRCPSAHGEFPKTRSYRNLPVVKYENETMPGAEAWWYDPQQGRLLGYDKKSSRLVGSFGPDGFVQPDGQPSERFPGELALYLSVFYKSWTNDYLVFSGGVYAVDFQTLTVQTIFAPAVGETVLWASKWQDEKQNLTLAFVGTDQFIHVLDKAGSQIFSTPLAYDRASYRIRIAGRLEGPERYWVWYEPAWYLGVGALETMPAYVVTYDRAGHEILPRQEVPTRPGGAREIAPPTILVEPSYAQAISGLITSPAEAAVLVGATEHVEQEVRDSNGMEAPVLLRFLVFTTQYFMPGVRWDLHAHSGLVFGFGALMLPSATVSALVCFLLAQRYSFSRIRRIGWALVGLSFGLAGLLLMLSLQEWPAHVACPKCRKPRVVTRDHCEHCGAPHALPAADGTEVFEETVDAPSRALASG
jgi:hypothetical protein